MLRTIQVLKALGLPYAYDHFAEGESPLPPFVVYMYKGTNNFHADGIAYYEINEVNIELYSDRKNIALEKRLEKLLKQEGICFSKSETWIPSEKLYEVLYIYEESVEDDKVDELEKRLDALSEKVDSIAGTTETSLSLVLTRQNIVQRHIELPEDCDVARAVTFAVQGVLMHKGTDWTLIERNTPEKDLISWDGFNLEKIIQVGDKVSVTYYRKEY